MSGKWITELSWPEVEDALAGGAIGVLPVGAAAKEHGRHLPLSTDCTQVEWVAERIRERCDCLVWPTISYGYYPVFVEYPGSISIDEEVFVSLVKNVLAGVSAAGAGRIAILNAGISTIAPLRRAFDGDGFPPEVRLVNLYDGPTFSATVARLAEQRWGGHADEVETSIMLALAPESVVMRRARPALGRIVGGMFNRSDPAGPNYSPDGVNGDPTLASAEKGTAFLDAILDDVWRALDGF
jgi:creatinine amidohydrolase